MRSEYDVIVIGAGPAGSLAARTAAQLGLDVLMIEKRQEIGEPVRCAEGVPVDGFYDFIEHDDRWVCAKITGGRIHAPDGTVLNFSQFNEGPAGLVLDRKIFDRSLAKMAADAGAEIRVKTRATSLLRENWTVKGIKGISEGNDFEAHAKITIGADGVESKIGRWAGLMGPLKLKDIETCAQFTMSDIDIDPECCEFYFGNAISPGGYVWVFPKGKREANVGVGILGTRCNGIPPVEYLQKYVNRVYPGGKVLQVIIGAVPVSNMNGRISTGGLMLAGDGARLADPLFGAGIMNAMSSGRMAGNNAAVAIKKGDVSAKALKRYDDEVRVRIGKVIRRNYQVKELLVNASDRQVNAIAYSFRHMNLENIPVASLFKTATSTGAPLLKMMRALI